jgi:flagellar FliL protein
MALARKTLIIAIIGVIVLIVGVVGGVFVGLKFFSDDDSVMADQIQDPGPMLELGQFSSTLADQEIHVVRLKITLEFAGAQIFDRVNAGTGWVVTIKDEVIKTLKDQRYDSIRFTEGMEKLKQDLKTRLNAILPRENGEAAVKKVLFDEYMTQ